MRKIEIDEIKLHKLYMALLRVDMRRSGIGGAAITGYTCARCDQEYSNGNTVTPLFCDSCKKALREFDGKLMLQKAKDRAND
jgi:DNA-directed RNA polymerase subunit RPC12/RpoP